MLVRSPPSGPHHALTQPTFRRRLAMAATKDLKSLFHATLKDIYFAEKKILTTLPKMAKAANDESLRAAFKEHREQTQGHVERLEKVFSIIGQNAQGKTCE